MRNKNSGLYHVSEKKIEKLSQLFNCLEDAIKELIRSPENGTHEICGFSELTFYEQTSQTIAQCDDELSHLF